MSDDSDKKFVDMLGPILEMRGFKVSADKHDTPDSNPSRLVFARTLLRVQASREQAQECQPPAQESEVDRIVRLASAHEMSSGEAIRALADLAKRLAGENAALADQAFEANADAVKAYGERDEARRMYDDMDEHHHRDHKDCWQQIPPPWRPR